MGLKLARNLVIEVPLLTQVFMGLLQAPGQVEVCATWQGQSCTQNSHVVELFFFTRPPWGKCQDVAKHLCAYNYSSDVGSAPIDKISIGRSHARTRVLISMPSRADCAGCFHDVKFALPLSYEHV